jgi:hypothetical protein
MTDRELEATDHLNKQMLEIYKRHLDQKTIHVPANGKIGSFLLTFFRFRPDSEHVFLSAAESDDWNDEDDYAKLCAPISEDADPSTLLVALPDDAAAAESTTAMEKE